MELGTRYLCIILLSRVYSNICTSIKLLVSTLMVNNHSLDNAVLCDALLTPHTPINFLLNFDRYARMTVITSQGQHCFTGEMHP